MGTDITTFFGKIKKEKSLDFHRRFTDTQVIGEPPGAELVVKPLMERLELNPLDFTIEQNETSHLIARDWKLYSFLYYGYSMQTIIPDHERMEQRKKRSAEFCAAIMYAHGDGEKDNNPFWPYFTDGGDKAIVFALLELTSFDYDAVAMVDNEADHDAINIPHPEGMTYRQVLPESYFKTLEEAVRDGWEFLAFTFSG